MVEPSVCGSDAAFCQITMTTCYRESQQENTSFSVFRLHSLTVSRMSMKITGTVEKKLQLECEPMPNVMAALPLFNAAKFG